MSTLSLGFGAVLGCLVGDVLFSIIALELRDRRRDARRPAR